ncbi:hypothetical protein MIMGU_mgv1a016018mg [Erythranthe guttata]|uniref:Uncharacterized protein n=1 Tax=Erythranthe guttata TaxID=4155 RepID=A0A022Q7F0_ERYGU|nr:hypothetical protein MIMGU_mgv1a016018mg [Erythranthe guttata]
MDAISLTICSPNIFFASASCSSTASISFRIISFARFSTNFSSSSFTSNTFELDWTISCARFSTNSSSSSFRLNTFELDWSTISFACFSTNSSSSSFTCKTFDLDVGVAFLIVLNISFLLSSMALRFVSAISFARFNI